MIDLKSLANRVLQEVDTYELPKPHPGALGAPLPPSWYEERLADLRSGLVEPYWAEVVDYAEGSSTPHIHKVVVVARDLDDNYLAYDPRQDRDEFAMVGTEGDGLHIYNIRGDDAVSTFLRF